MNNDQNLYDGLMVLLAGETIVAESKNEDSVTICMYDAGTQQLSLFENFNQITPTTVIDKETLRKFTFDKGWWTWEVDGKTISLRFPIKLHDL